METRREMWVSNLDRVRRSIVKVEHEMPKGDVDRPNFVAWKRM